MGKLYIAVLCWSSANLFIKLALARLPLSVVYAWEIGGMMIGGLAVLLLFERIPRESGEWWGASLAFLTGSTVMVGNYLFLKTLVTEKLAVASPITSLTTLLSVLLGILVVGESLNLFQKICAGLVIMGIVGLTWQGGGK